MTFRPKQPFVQPDELKVPEIVKTPEQKVLVEVRAMITDVMLADTGMDWGVGTFVDAIYKALDALEEKYK